MRTTFQSLEALSRPYRHIYLEPHLDDIALSCGGLAALQVDRAEATLVITFFAGNPGPTHPLTSFAAAMHSIWGDDEDMVAVRHAEQVAALGCLGADWLQLTWFDAIYREDRYLSDEQLFGSIHGNDLLVIEEIRDTLRELSRMFEDATWYVPLAVGNHVDHQVLFNASDVLENRMGYEDFPYAAKTGLIQSAAARVGALSGPVVDISRTIDRKIEAIAYYQSQMGNLFGGSVSMRRAVRAFAAARGAGDLSERYWLLAPSRLID